MEWHPINGAPRDGAVIPVRDAQGREAQAWWDRKSNQWRSGGVEHGDPLKPELDGHPWAEWGTQDGWKIVRISPVTCPQCD